MIFVQTEIEVDLKERNVKENKMLRESGSF